MKKRIVCLMLAALLVTGLLPVGGLADWSTTTVDSAAKDFGDHTEIYVLTDKDYGRYPDYGAKWEPTSGAYYGRPCRSGTLPDGRYGVVNSDQLADESIVSFYTSLRDPYSLSYWSYLYGAVLKDGHHALLINLNFDYEGADCAPVTFGQFDAKLTEDFSYLATLDVPVFLRVAAEVNVWTDRPEAGAYIAAFRHIAELVRRIASNVAVVFAPNYSSAFEVDMDDYYPGDSYVDWVGVSLYYDRYSHTGIEGYDKFLGVGEYADALLNVQQGVNLSRMHKKPLMATEGGSSHLSNGKDTLDFAADRVEKAYAFLTMVYPELKCIVYSDTNFGSTKHLYSIYDNQSMTAAYDRGVATNPTLRREYGQETAYYSRLSDVTDALRGTVTFAAYTNAAQRLEAHWYVDGTWTTKTSNYPYRFVLDTEKLEPGTHTIEVRFSNGCSRSGELTVGLTLNRVAAVAPTCTVAGNIEYWTDAGGNCYADDAGTRAIGKSETAVPALGHDWGAWTETKAPTTTACGERVRTCRRDGSHTETEKLPPQNFSFTDVPLDGWYTDAVLWAVANGVTNGTGDTTFSPSRGCTRGQVAAFLWRAYGSAEPSLSENPFSDVASSAYYCKPVLWAVEHGVTNGLGADRFGPDATCTRGQVVTFLWRAAGSPEPGSQVNPFTDVKSGDYFYKAVLWAVENGITQGTSATTFSPAGTCTRAHVVTFLYRAVGK